jgi:hypothetical protein
MKYQYIQKGKCSCGNRYDTYGVQDNLVQKDIDYKCRVCRKAINIIDIFKRTLDDDLTKDSLIEVKLNG